MEEKRELGRDVPRSSSAANESRFAEVVGTRDCPSIRPLFSGVLKGSPLMSARVSKFFIVLKCADRTHGVQLKERECDSL